MVSDGIVIARENGERKLTASAFQSLADVPPEVEWFENIENKNTRRAYRNDIREFMTYAGIRHSGEIRTVKRAHVIAWRKQLEIQALEAPTIRRKLSALSSLFVFLCESNAIEFNPVDGVKCPSAAANEGKSPALSDDRAKALLNAPSKDTVKRPAPPRRRVFHVTAQLRSRVVLHRVAADSFSKPHAEIPACNSDWATAPTSIKMLVMMVFTRSASAGLSP